MNKPHLSPGELLSAASGNPSDPQILAHLAACPECTAEMSELRAASDLFAPLRNSGPDPADHPTPEALANYGAGLPNAEILAHLARCRRCAEILAAADPVPPPLPVPIPFPKPIHRVWFALAAALLLTLSTWGVWRFTHPDPADLLAKAYTEARPFEFRLPDAGYSLPRIQRGGNSTAALPLLEALPILRRQLQANPTDPATQALSARGALLERNYEAAIQLLNDAHQALPDDLEILADLAVALAARGQQERRTSDYGQAMDDLLQILRRDPKHQRTLFNLALVQEELALMEEAAATWRQFLALDPPAGWKAEARRHLDQVLIVIEDKKKADADVVSDPEKFLVAYDLNRELDPLPYFETFWMDWLPAMQTELKERRNGPATQAAHIVAQGFAARGEVSLRETLDNLNQDRNDGLLRLASVMTGNAGHDVESPLRTAPPVARDLSAAGLSAAAALAHIQAAYAFRRASRLSECREELDRPLRLAPEKYRWLNAVAHLEHLACLEGAGEGDQARAEGNSAFESTSAHLLWPLALRSAVFLASIDSGLGNYMPVWDRAPRQMRDYWHSQANHLRLQGFLVYLSDAAAAAGWKESALLLIRGAARHAGLAGHFDMQATNYGTGAALLLSLGQRSEAIETLNLAGKLLAADSASPEGVRSNLWWDTQVALVEAQAEAPPDGGRSAQLSRLLQSAATRDVRYRIRLHQTSGLSLLRSGDRPGAQSAFQAAVDLDRELAAGLSWVDRIPVAELAAPSYRNLTQLQLDSDSNKGRALQTWMTYRPRPGRTSLSITFADLPRGLFVFTEGPAGVTVRKVDVLATEIHRTAERFIALCGAPDSEPQALNDLGARLYRWLLAPELAGRTSETISISPTSGLTGLPWVALRDTSQTWLGERFVLLHNYGPSPRPATSVGSATSLIVAAPEGRIPGGGSLPALPDARREAETILARLPGAALLANASASEIATRAHNLQAFHFTGHGWANGGNGALVLPPAPDGTPRYLSAREIAAQDWSRCQLAVLSACLTASGAQRGRVDNESLVNAFLSAGARQVVASRWSVDSASTRALMENFYASRKSGLSPPAALAAAAQKVSHEARWSHPYYWAGFALFGAM